MTLRDKVTKAMLDYAPIPAEKVHSSAYPFYYKDYADNLYMRMGHQALQAYENGSGSETKPYTWNGNGKTVKCPPKMASIASSSAMTFNLLGDGPAKILPNSSLPTATYQVQYEKQMYPLRIRGYAPANLDVFLSNETEKTAIFCEMKLLEWLNEPGTLKDSYRDSLWYFPSDDTAVSCPVAAFPIFQKVIEEIELAAFQRYDAWQMLKHLLAIYHYTSITSQKWVDTFRKIPSMAGKYNRIILANVVNEFPPERIGDISVRDDYWEALEEEKDEAQRFMKIIQASGMAHLFDNNCNAGIEVKYMSAKDFAACLDMSQAKKDYLKRYFT